MGHGNDIQYPLRIMVASDSNHDPLMIVRIIEWAELFHP